MVLKSFGVFSVGKMLGTMYAIIGLIIGAFVSLFALIGASAEGEGAMGLLLGVGAIILMPIFYGISGFIGGVISALIYNIVAGIAGGIEVNLE